MPQVRVDRLAVITALTRDTARTAAFYRDVLGLKLLEENHDGLHTHYSCPLGSALLIIASSADVHETPPDRGHDSLQLCFTVADLNRFMQHLQEKKITPLHSPQRFLHTSYITLLDPDCRHVRVMTPWEE